MSRRRGSPSPRCSSSRWKAAWRRTRRSERAGRPMSWYTDFFASGDYARVYEGLEEDAARQAACVVRELALKPGERLLDLCCGTGRHARELRARGARVAGLDLDRASLLRAGVPCARAEMRSLPLRSA